MVKKKRGKIYSFCLPGGHQLLFVTVTGSTLFIVHFLPVDSVFINNNTATCFRAVVLTYSAERRICLEMHGVTYCEIDLLFSVLLCQSWNMEMQCPTEMSRIILVYRLEVDHDSVRNTSELGPLRRINSQHQQFALNTLYLNLGNPLREI